MGVDRRRATRRAAILVAAVTLVIVSAAARCQGREPYENQWGPFKGTVVDATTGQPVPGAVFTVIWVRQIPMIAEAWEYFYDARVAVADESGHFEIPRRFPALLSFLIQPVSLSCIAPDYAPFRDVGTQNAPISVRLRRLTTPEEMRSGFFDVSLQWIPDDMRPRLETGINESRTRMGLRPIEFPWGGYRKE